MLSRSRILIAVALLAVPAAWAQQLQKITINYPTRSGASWLMSTTRQSASESSQRGAFAIVIGLVAFQGFLIVRDAIFFFEALDLGRSAFLARPYFPFQQRFAGAHGQP